MAETDLAEVTMEGVKLIFRNFKGEEKKFNPPGQRNFGVLIDDENARAMQEDGWPIKWLEPREDADEGEAPQAFLPVKVKYGKGRPPLVALITSRGRTMLEERELDMLDWVTIENVDLIVRPFPWEMPDGKTGISAYLKSIYITIEEDPLEQKYAEVPVQ